MYSWKFRPLQFPPNTWRPLAISLTFVLFVAALNLSVTPALAAQGKQKLDKHYKDWLEHDVVYIITKDERDAFAKLTTDEARDKFISEFWEIRNPNPGSPTNAYKEEIYKRIAFANARYSLGSVSEGWRTDRGHTYITLGPPQQKQIWRNAPNLRGIEVWFYQNVNPALPPYFYVMFYDKNGGNDYRFYSPYFDGPDKLTTGVEAQNSRLQGLHMIQESVGGELARISLSLIPGEPVDVSTGVSSLQSDTMLTLMKSLADQPSNRAEINRRRMLRENVTSSMVLSGNNLDIITLPVRDTRGITRLDFAIRMRNPADLAVANAPDGQLRYSIQVRVQVFGQDKLIFTQDKSLTDGFDKRRYNEIKDKSLSYESWLPLPPGKYRLAFQFTDWNKNTSYRAERDVVIPSPAADKLVVPGILPFSTAEQVDPGTAEVTPFTLAGVKFVPLRTTGLALNPDVNLQVAYQIWGQGKDPRTYAGQKLHLEYSVGQPAAPGSSKTVQDDAEMSQFDLGGSLVSGKKLDLQNRPPGNYMLTVTAKDPSSAASGFATMNFKVFEGPSNPEPWEVVEPSIRTDADNGIFDQERGLCYLAQGLDSEGRSWFRRALNANHRNEIAREHLVKAYYAQNDFAAVVSLYKDAGITESAAAETYLRIANSLQKTGDVKGAITLAESGLQVHPKDVSLYLGLAEFYKQIGNNQKAEEMIKKGKSYSPAS